MRGRRAYVHDGPLGRDDERGEELRREDGPEEVHLEHVPHRLQIRVQHRHPVARPRVVDEDVQGASGLLLDDLDRVLDALPGGHVQLEERHVVQGRERLHLGRRAGGGEDMETFLLEGFDQSAADAAGTAAGDEDRLGSHRTL